MNHIIGKLEMWKVVKYGEFSLRQLWYLNSDMGTVLKQSTKVMSASYGIVEVNLMTVARGKA